MTRLDAAFASQPELPRVSINRAVTLDLAAATSFTLDVMESGSDGGGPNVGVSLYFRSGKGWYSGGSAISKAGWRTLVFPRQAFSIEGKPAGWQHIDGIRISVWRPQREEARDTAFFLRNLKSRSNNTAILLPDAGSPDRKTSMNVAERLEQMLHETGIGADLIEAKSLASGTLGSRPLAILPYNPRLDRETIAAL
ncbi:MAG: hypothetical protein GY953_48000, partial [bacterium]|nr:hypothetical protein [bacterium]